ncbi:MAG: hypothetical protein K6E50_14310 [Lachnospiraceae bacterium]|nr:hypothetical protein [Lachnospiraceae bacterium]
MGLLICALVILFLNGISWINMRITRGAEKLRPAFQLKRTDGDGIDVYVWQIGKRSHYYDRVPFVKNKKGKYVIRRSGFLRVMGVLGILLWGGLTAGALYGYVNSRMEPGKLLFLLGLPLVLLLHLLLIRLIGGGKEQRAKKYLMERLEKGGIDAIPEGGEPIPEDINGFNELDILRKAEEDAPESREAYRSYINDIRLKFVIGFFIFFWILMGIVAVLELYARFRSR